MLTTKTTTKKLLRNGIIQDEKKWGSLDGKPSGVVVGDWFAEDQGRLISNLYLYIERVN